MYFNVYADAIYVRDGRISRTRVGRDFDRDAQPNDFIGIWPSIATDDEILTALKRAGRA